MASIPPPQGLNDVDYEAIEAAVTETVRGRWFLNEFARRNRTIEMRQILDAMSRVETIVAGQPRLEGPGEQAALPSADPSVRLLIQRIKEIAGSLESLAEEMHEAEVDERFCRAVGGQAKAVAGMMRGAPPRSLAPPAAPRPTASASPEALAASPEAAAAASERRPLATPPRMPRANLPSSLAGRPGLAAPLPETDPRLAVLSGLDGLTLAQKLSLFT
jgi:hypothetical protein